MRDLDFDELDKAVKAVMSESGIAGSDVNVNSQKSVSASTGSGSNSIPVTHAPSAAPVHKGPLVGGSKESFRPAKRNRLFMDVKPPANKDLQYVNPLVDNDDKDEGEGRKLSQNGFNSRVFEPAKEEPKVEEKPVEEKAPFEDAFASLQNEVNALGIEDKPKTDPLTLETPKEDTPRETEGPEEDVSFSPFLSSVAIDKRPLGGYSDDKPVDTPAPTSPETTGKRSANDFYGLDPLADMTIEDIDATIVDPEGISSEKDATPVPVKEEGTNKTLSELGSRIERELNGESTDDESPDGHAELVRRGKDGQDEPEVSKDEFHKEAPIYQEEEVIADFDAKFSDAEVDDPNDKIIAESMVAIESAKSKQEAEFTAKSKDLEKKTVEQPKETPESVKEEGAGAPELEGEPVKELTAEEKLGAMTISPDDDSVSVEQVALMEESIAAQTEGPTEQPKKRGLLGKVKPAVKDKKESVKSQDKPSILREGGPGSIQPQYRASADAFKTDKTEHSTFNPDSFAMPVGTKVKPTKGISPVVMAAVAIGAVAVGVGGAFALFYSGLI